MRFCLNVSLNLLGNTLLVIFPAEDEIALPTAGRNFSPNCSLNTSIPVSMMPFGRASIQWSPSSTTSSPVQLSVSNSGVILLVVDSPILGTKDGCTVLNAVSPNISVPSRTERVIKP